MYLLGRKKLELKNRVIQFLTHIKQDSSNKKEIGCLSSYYKLYDLNSAYGTCLFKEEILLRTANGAYYWNPAVRFRSYEKILALKLINSVNHYKNAKYLPEFTTRTVISGTIDSDV